MGGGPAWASRTPCSRPGGEAALGHYSILESDRVGAGRDLRDDQAPETLRGEAHTGVGRVES